MDILWFSLIAGLAALVYGVFLMRQVLNKPRGDEKMISISEAIREAANAFFKRESKVIMMVGAVIAAALMWSLGREMAIGFVIGAMASGLAGYVGMFVATRANSRVAEAAKSGIVPAFNLAFRGGAVTGFFVAGLALLSVAGF